MILNILVFANSDVNKETLAVLDSFIVKISIAIINPLLYALFTLAFLLFVWGVFIYFINPDSKEREKGAQHILWGVVGMFIMISAFGIINLIKATINSNPQNFEVNTNNLQIIK